MHFSRSSRSLVADNAIAPFTEPEPFSFCPCPPPFCLYFSVPSIYQVEVTNCFAVPHAERGDEVAIGKDFNRQMLALHLRANRKETVVGWYATALPDDAEEEGGGGYRCIADTSSLIHEFYAGECDDDPVHLVVDTSLQTDAVSLRAYRSTPVQVRGEPLANLFHEIGLAVRCSESERISVDRMVKAQQMEGGREEEKKASTGDEDEAVALRASMERLLGMLETASAYVDGVVEGKTPADDAVGRKIEDALSAIPRIRPEVFDRMFNDSLQDLLMVTYLSNVARTQLTIAEKLNATLAV